MLYSTGLTLQKSVQHNTITSANKTHERHTITTITTIPRQQPLPCKQTTHRLDLPRTGAFPRGAGPAAASIGPSCVTTLLHSHSLTRSLAHSLTHSLTHTQSPGQHPSSPMLCATRRAAAAAGSRYGRGAVRSRAEPSVATTPREWSGVESSPDLIPTGL